jgi:hypothetical protein
MGRPNPQIVARLRRTGFIPIGVAAKAFGQPRTTIAGWIKTKRVRGVRVGYFVFVNRASMRAAMQPREA